MATHSRTSTHKPQLDDRHQDAEHDNSERWLLTYADMITLLLALFIVLYSISVVNKSKFDAFTASLHKSKAVGQPEIQHPAPHPTTTPMPPDTVLHKDLKALEAQLHAALAKAHLTNAATLRINTQGLEVRLTDGVLFNTGKAALLPAGIRVLQAIGPVIAAHSNPVEVRGYTDNVVIKTAQFPTNWELSTARATSVLRYLLDAFHLAPGRMSATGYGETHPLVPNTSAANRARNRRVVVEFVAPLQPQAAAAAPPAPAAGGTATPGTSPPTPAVTPTSGGTGPSP
ncbi:MAG TPA: flagellar motor protein MotB [Mycobacteriales bacterium]|nr:flagellar motor protein MotB [Mycobacteriales bacterium]